MSLYNKMYISTAIFMTAQYTINLFTEHLEHFF